MTKYTKNIYICKWQQKSRTIKQILIKQEEAYTSII